MAEFTRNKRSDHRYSNMVRDREKAPRVDVGGSIRDLRRIYKDYSDADFAAWYSVRYGIRMAAVLAVLKTIQGEAGGAHGKTDMDTPQRRDNTGNA